MNNYRFLPLMLAVILLSCAAPPLPEDVADCPDAACVEAVEEKEYDDYKEAERKEAYLIWEANCLALGKVIYADNPTRPCRKLRGCIPSSWDWRFKYDEKDVIVGDFGNAYSCETHSDIMREIYRGY